MQFSLIQRSIALLLALLQLSAPLTVFADPNDIPAAPQSESSSPAQESEIEASLDRLGEVIDGRAEGHDLDNFRLLDQEFSQSRVATPVELASPLAMGPNRLGHFTIEEASTGRRIFEYRPRVLSSTRIGNRVYFVEERNLLHTTDGRQITHLSFIDLEFFSSTLGLKRLPVFTVPVEGIEGSSLETQMGGLSQERGLILGGRNIPEYVLNGFSFVNQLLWNWSINILDPKAYKDLSPVIDDFEREFSHAAQYAGEGTLREMERVAGGAQNLRQFRERQVERLRAQGEAAPQAPNTQSQEANVQEYLSQGGVRDMLREIVQQRTSQRKLSARIKIILSRLSIPRPEGVATLENALFYISLGLKPSFRHASISRREAIQEGLLRLAYSRAGRIGVAGVAAMVAGITHPEAVNQFWYQAVDVVSSVKQSLMGIGSLAGNSVLVVTEGFSPQAVKEAYFTPENFPKFMEGFMAIATTLYTALGIPHLTVNTVKLARAYTQERGEATLSSSGILNRVMRELSFFRSFFINRQDRLERDYLASLGNASSTHQGSYTPEEARQIEELHARLVQEDEARSNLIVRAFKRLNIFRRTEGQTDQQSSQKITSLGTAMRHFLFSYAALTESGTAYTTIWNSWFLFRSFMWKPSVWLTAVAYPEFFPRLLSDARVNLSGMGREGSLGVPSLLNGGLRTLPESAWVRIRGAFATEQFEALKLFESKISAVEESIRTSAQERAFLAVAERATTPAEYARIMEMGRIPGLDSPQYRELARQQQLYYMIYSEELAEAGLREFLIKEIMNADPNLQSDLREVELDSLSLRELKKQAVELANSLNFSTDTIPARIAELDRSEGIHLKVDQEINSHLAARTGAEARRFLRQLQERIISQVDPGRSRQTYRALLARQQARDPRAMARAVRAMVAATVVDKPMELMMNFVMFSAVTAGLTKPIQDVAFGPNSWHFLSREVFLKGYVSGVIIGVLADVWSKLQTDAANQEHFGEVPTGSDAQGSFLNWWTKKTFRNAENTWWKQHKLYCSLIWANMPAAMATFLLTDLTTRGRFDLGFYITGYMAAYLLPLSGFGVKLEQGFEMAAGYFLRDIPEHFRGHPLMVALANGRIAAARVRFNLAYKLWENFWGSAVSQFITMDLPGVGSRSFERLLAGGRHITDWVVLGAQSLNASPVGQIPGVQAATRTCVRLLTNNYTGSPVIDEFNRNNP